MYLVAAISVFRSCTNVCVFVCSSCWARESTQSAKTQYLIVLCTGTRYMESVFDLVFWQVKNRYASNEKYTMSLKHEFTTSSSCMSGNNHALPQHLPNPVSFLSIRRVFFHSNAANHSAKPPCLILMWVAMLSFHGVRLRWFTDKRTC